MSSVLSRRLLWAALLLTVPVPIWFIGGGRAPTLALFQITGYLIPVWITDGGPTARLATLGLGLQGLFWAAMLYLVARSVVWCLARLGKGQPSVAGVAVVIAGLFIVSFFQVYATPLIARGASVNLFGAY